MKNLIILLAISLALGACLKSEKTAQEPAAEIGWFAGGMEQALAKAKDEKKPLFVYWGAKWCPPCNVVRSTIFTAPDVIQATGKYISVYLDGDTDSAQKWGEELKALGYPTLMVLNSEGKEVVRLDSSGGPKDFALALDSAFENLYPIEDLIGRILAQKAADVPLEQWQMLASYSWSQARHLKETVDFAESYRKLYEHIPANQTFEKTQLLLNWAMARIQKVNSKDSPQPLTEAEKKKFLQAFQSILADEGAFSRHYKVFAYSAEDFVKSLFAEKSPQRDEFVKSYTAALSKVREGLPVGSHGRLVTFYPLLDFARLDEDKAALPDESKTLIEKEMKSAVESISNAQEQVFVTSTASYFLRESGRLDLARDVLKQDIEKSKTPYYSMAALAGIEKREGNALEAVQWMERAYSSSKGHSTRLQWGSGYLSYLLDLSPENESLILTEVQKYYREHLKKPDAFMGRNKYRLNRLAKKLKEWSESKERKSQLTAMSDRWLERCQKVTQTKTDYYREACQKYFSDLI